MKNLCVMLVPILIFAQTSEEIVKNINIKEVVEMYLEAYGSIFAPFYPAEMHFRIYKTAEYLKGVAEYLYAEWKGVDTSQLTTAEKVTISALLHSSHVAIGELLERKSYRLYEEYKVKIIKVFMGEFKNDTIIVKTETGEGVTRVDYFSFIPWFPHDTLFLFLNTFFGFDRVSRLLDKKYIDSIGYECDFFAAGQADDGMWCIKEIESRKRIYTPWEQSYEYKEVYTVVNYLTPIIKEVIKEVKNYKFPSSKKEYVEFMKKRGYKEPESWESMKRAVNRWEEFIKNKSWRRK